MGEGGEALGGECTQHSLASSPVPSALSAHCQYYVKNLHVMPLRSS